MIRVRWELEEAVALMNLYFRYGATLGVPNDELLKLSQIYRNRANILGLNVDDKFRNLSGMKMQARKVCLAQAICFIRHMIFTRTNQRDFRAFAMIFIKNIKDDKHWLRRRQL